MMAIDTSSLVAYLAGDEGPDVDTVEVALAERRAVLPVVVLTELLSSPRLTKPDSSLLLAIPRLEPTPGYWERVGSLRARVLAKKLRARLADSLIAQLCIDHRATLVTRDNDFRHFARVGRLTLAV